MRTVIVRAPQSQCVEDALCVKTHPRMAMAPIPFSPLTLLPAQVLWEGSDVSHVAPSEAASDDEIDRPMADVADGTDAPVVGASSIFFYALVPAPQVSAVPVPGLVADRIKTSIPVTSLAAALAANALTDVTPVVATPATAEASVL